MDNFYSTFERGAARGRVVRVTRFRVRIPEKVNPSVSCSNQGKIWHREKRNGFRFSYTCTMPKIQRLSNPYCPYGHYAMGNRYFHHLSPTDWIKFQDSIILPLSKLCESLVLIRSVSGCKGRKRKDIFSPVLTYEYTGLSAYKRNFFFHLYIYKIGRHLI